MIELVIEASHVISVLSLLSSLAKGLHNCIVLCEFGTTGASPSTGKPIALIAVIACAFLRETVMFLEGVLAETFEIVCAMRGDIVEAFAFALGSIAGRLLARRIEIVVVLELVVTEAFCFRTDHLAVLTSLVAPREIEPILRFFGNGEAHRLSDVHLL